MFTDRNPTDKFKLIVKTLGASGINALSRIIGFIVIAIGVEYILSTLLFLVAMRT